MTNRPRPRNVEVGASFRLLSSGRGVVEVAPETMDYCLSVPTSVTAVASVGVSASVSSGSLVFSMLPGSTVLSGVLDKAVI